MPTSGPSVDFRIGRLKNYLASIRKRPKNSPKAIMTKPFAFSALPAELQLEVISYLTFKDTVNLRMTGRKYRYFIPAPSHEQLLAAENSEWAIKKNLFTCCHCLQLRPSTKFADKMISGKRARGYKGAPIRFCIECGLTVPWKTSGARGYSRGNKIRILGKPYQVCKNCGLFKPFPVGYRPNLETWNWCPHGYEPNRKKVEGKYEDLAEWREEYRKAAKERDDHTDDFQLVWLTGDIQVAITKSRPGLEYHGLPPSCL
ncbi:hypothetical protein BT63DRAFT_430303 [Microthyrium microscopicum]|uniref:F-box domain-containing protein n=1 Tax=Microthyrium microscopicum TaxID=703497 RepID=A0A6A6TWD2_9PEZI|nr:hypothetical protein BT63DRAFT_430303 [Microthyrium microscopicum]